MCIRTWVYLTPNHVLLPCRVVIAKVNADEHRSLGERFGVQGFPTLKWFSRGKAVDSPDE